MSGARVRVCVWCSEVAYRARQAQQVRAPGSRVHGDSRRPDQHRGTALWRGNGVRRVDKVQGPECRGPDLQAI